MNFKLFSSIFIFCSYKIIDRWKVKRYSDVLFFNKILISINKEKGSRSEVSKFIKAGIFQERI